MSERGQILDTVHAALDAGRLPRVHGNGFIQLDINETQRMHFWGHADIPRQATPSPIHDHVFGFRSDCLLGSILNINYNAYAHTHGMFDIHKADPTSFMGGVNGWKMTPVGQRCNIEVIDHFVVSANQSYDMPAYVLHETIFGEPSVTLITKDAPTLAQNPTGPSPRILVPFGQSVDNIFDRNAFPVQLLTQIIHEIVERGRFNQQWRHTPPVARAS